MKGSRVLLISALAAVLSLLSLEAEPVLGATFTVNSTLDTDDATPEGTCDSDPGAPVACTLREAIREANFVAGTDTINFSIGTGQQTIVLGSSLPNVNQPTIIDGTTQPGFAGTPLIELNGNNVAGTGLNITAGSSTVWGLVINRVNGSGIVLQTAGSNTIRGNYIGTDTTGTLDLGNVGAGVIILSGGSNCIGGTIIATVCTPSAADRNLISGNNGAGISIQTTAGTANTVVGNYIGTDITGTLDRGNSQQGIQSGSGSNTIGGLTSVARNVISGNDSYGIELNGGTLNQILGNYIGTNAAGTAALGNNSYGVRTVNLAASNTIGGTSAGARNVISANNNNGVNLATNSNQVLGNYIGTDATGTVDLGNGGEGVHVEAGATNVVGGTTDVTAGGPCTGACNLISGNGLAGVRVLGATGTTVRGNFIGTDAAGTADLGNSADGITLFQPTIVGGALTGAGNVISGNNQDGVEINSTSANSSTVQQNLIGTNAAGTTGIGNSSFAIRIQDASNITIGGTSFQQGNTIAFNGFDGVFMITSISAPTGNSVRGNKIHSDNQLGIDLAPDGVTANDAGDGDTGPNNLQNFPALTAAVKQGSTTLVTGTLNSTTNTTFNLDFYASAACDPSGNGEGATYLGTTAVTTDGTGNVSFPASPFIAPSQVGQFVTATATRNSAPLDTSEFSNCVSVAPMVVDTTSDASLTACTSAAGDCSLRGAITNANGLNSDGDLITFNIPIVPDPGCDDFTGVCTITIGTALPSLQTGSDTIDATVATIVVDGAAEPSPFPCLTLESPQNTVKGLQITDCTYGVVVAGIDSIVGPDNVIFDNSIAGVAISSGVSGSVIKGNKIGTTADGTAINPDGGNATGVQINASGNTVGGATAGDRNIISGNSTGVNILVSGSNNNVVKGNYVGTDITGNFDLGNTFEGINVATGVSGNVIGGTAAGEGNLISGNNQYGIRFFGNAGQGRPNANVVQGNLIGTNAAGTADLGNSLDGIIIDGGQNNCIGGTFVALVCVPVLDGRNVISGNNNSGVKILGDTPTGNKLFENYIGTDIFGATDLGNSQHGVNLEGASANVVGSPSGPNVISGNDQNGVRLSGSHSNNVHGNLIGTTRDGNAALGNSNQNIRIDSANFNDIFLNVIAASGDVGIRVGGTSNGSTIVGNLIGTDFGGTIPLGNVSHGVYLLSPSTTVGGTGAGQRNIIAFNGGDGVRVEGASATPNPIRGNSIHSNIGMGIENLLGGNGELTPPAVASAGSAAGTSTCAGCTIDVFSDNAGEGRVYQGSATTDGSGNWTFGGGVVGPNVTATVTNGAGQTSEFSAPFACPDPDADLLCASADPCPGDDDCDNDGWMDGSEANFIGTDPLDNCPDNSADDAWPPDFNDDQSVTGADLSALAAVIGLAVPPAPPRRDIGQPPDGAITGADLSAVAARIGTSCVP